jgi:glucosamine--fructose-6-phosphate aminotransferase (isomerizing)
MMTTMSSADTTPSAETTTALQREIREQPEVLRELLRSGWSAVSEAARRIQAFDPAWINIAARGTSDNAARYAQYLFGVHNQLGVALAAASLCTLYDAAPRMQEALTIGVSQSGQSPDVVSVIQAARKQGGLTLAITNDPDSPLAHAADICLELHAGTERSVAASKTYTTELAVFAMLSAAMTGREEHREALFSVPNAVAATIASASATIGRAVDFADARRLIVVGRGFNYSTAFEIALKLKETSYVLAEPYSSADLLHGPAALIEPDLPVMLVAPSGRSHDSVVELLDLAKKRGARTLAISDVPHFLERADLPLAMPREIPEWLSPICAVIPGQLFAETLSLAKGIDPDRPRGLSKVTLTH